MTMLPLCSATPTCSSHSQIALHGGLRPVSAFQKEIEARFVLEQRLLGLSNQRDVVRSHATKSLHSSFVKGTETSVSANFVTEHSCKNESGYLSRCDTSDVWSSSSGEMFKTHPVGGAEIKYVEDSNLSAVDSGFQGFSDKLNENADVLSESAKPETITSIDFTPEAIRPETVAPFDLAPEASISLAPSVSLDVGGDSLSNSKSSFEDFVSGVSNTFNDSINKGENAVKGSIETINSSIQSVVKSVNEAVEGAVGKTFSAVDQTGELAGNKAANFSSDLNESASKAADIAVYILRQTIVAVEDSLANGSSFVSYAYQSAKQLLPPEIKDTLNLSEEKANEFLSPAKIVFQKVYVAIEGLEGSLGFDPKDPIVPFVLVLGTSATLWVFYWVLTYSGYAGDLSPQLTLEILSGKENALLIDIRPEALRERDGIPALRRAARFRFTSVTVPEVDSSLRSSLKNGRELEDALTAVVIRNLKIAQDRSKFIILDADGARSKGVARSLRKLGVKEAYLVQGGFRSWVKDGLRIKELKAETALTILNEEAEAILEDIKPSPVQIIGYGLGLVAVSYAVLEWESTLQYIGVLGLAQTIFRRVASYQSAEDLNKDVSQLLTPARLGGQAFSWAAEKLETNLNGLPTSPSSSDVQNRVLQAAAKHESQPSDGEVAANQSSESTLPLTEKVDLSEA